MPTTDQSFFQKISKELRQVRTAMQVKKKTLAAIEWYTGKVQSTVPKKIRVNLLMYGRRAVQSYVPGQMILFRYQAKGFDEGTLSYFDAAPIVIILGENKHGNLLGLNLHYLPPPVRLRVLGLLMKPINAKKLRHDTKLRVTYQAVQSIAALAPLQYAIHSYIPNRMAGKVVRVQPAEWHHAAAMPVAQFIGKSARGVWASNPHS